MGKESLTVTGEARPFRHHLGTAHRKALHLRGYRRAGLPGGCGLPWQIPLCTWHSLQRVSRAAVDDAHVRRLWYRRGDQRPLQIPHGAWGNRAQCCLRYAHPYGIRHRCPTGRGGVWQVWRGDLLPRRYGGAFQWHPPGPGNHIDDHKQPRMRDLGHVHRRR